jgi:non-heme Fe2+,alpha-ketoglutarate-dependent halogenase
MTPEELSFFEKNGFLIGPSIRGAEAMDREREELEAVLATDGFARDPTVHRHLDSRAVHDLCTGAAIVERVAALLGPDLLLWHSRFFPKAPGAEVLNWHQDKKFWPIAPDNCVSAWIAIDQADRGNACVEVIPGSHRLRVPHISSTEAGRHKQKADPEHIDDSGKVAIELEPGQFFLFDRWLVHGSPANRSDRRRLALSARFVPTRVRVDVDSMAPRFPELGPQLIRGSDQFGRNRLVSPP